MQQGDRSAEARLETSDAAALQEAVRAPQALFDPPPALAEHLLLSTFGTTIKRDGRRSRSALPHAVGQLSRKAPSAVWAPDFRLANSLPRKFSIAAAPGDHEGPRRLDQIPICSL
jgi:hypothetical protein